MKAKRRIAWLLSFLMIFSLLMGMFPMQVRAEGGTANVTITSDVDVAIQFRSAEEKEGATIYSDPENTKYLFESGTVSGLPESGTIYIAIEPSLGASNTYSSISINGVAQTFHNGTNPNVYEVGISDSYNIVIEGTDAISYTIMWTNSGATNVDETDYASADCMIGNGKAYVKAVYDNATNMSPITGSITNIESGCVDGDGKGYVALEAGNVVDFEFIPDYGYQLTGIGANDTTLNAQDTQNQFRFVMPDAHIHFNATFTPTEDIVAPNADSISEGNIELSEGALSGGTAKLEVNNATIDNQGAFENAAEGYVVSDYLDISLHNIFYKGKNDANDVWSTTVEELDNPAEITLRLNEGISGEEVKVVHEKGNGEFELLDASYNPQTQEISFSTSSFSNYAIAYVESGDNNESDSYSVNFEPGSWTIGEDVVSVQVEGLREEVMILELATDDVITLTNFNPETMDAVLIVDEDVTLFLNVDENGTTSLANVDGGVEVLPPEGSMIFSVVEKPQGNEYFVNFGAGTWTIDEDAASVDVWQFNEYIPFLDTDPIQISGFNPETMDAVLIVDEDVTLPLIVDAEGNTMLTAIGTGELPEPGSYMSFEVRKKPEFNNTTNKEANACGADLAELTDDLNSKLLTDAEKTRLENGEEVKVWLEATDISASVSQTDKDLIDSKKGNTTIGMYLDIDLLKQIGSDSPVNITETDGAVTITLKVPSSLINSNSSVTRTYQMIRVHNGVATVIPCTYNAANQTISFETDQFSTYALAYVDQQNNSGGGNTGGGSADGGNKGGENTGGENTGSGSTDSGNTGGGNTGGGSAGDGSNDNVKDVVPKTGDASNAYILFILALVSGIGALYFGKKGLVLKKEN